MMETIKERKILFKRKNIGGYNIYSKGILNNEKIFIKKYPSNYPNEKIISEFEKTNQINHILKTFKNIKSSKSISYNLEKKEILFFYEKGINLQKLLSDENLSDKRLNQIFYDIGFGLFKIHQNLKKNYKKKEFIYGDLAINNILINNSEIIFIDFGPLRDNNAWKKENIFEDLVNFVRSFKRLPFKKIKLHHTRNLDQLEYKFLEGYSTEEPLNIKKYLNYKLENLYRNKNKKSIRGIIDIYSQYKLKNRLIDKYDYRKDYINQSKVDSYDMSYENEDNFHTLISNLYEKERLIKIIKKLKNKDKYLDFATGTGRVIKEIEKYFDEPYGVDISKEMLSKAKRRIKNSKLIQADITKGIPRIINHHFDCITAFRFFLNSNPKLRYEVIFKISKLLSNDGLFIFNIHGNKKSIYYFYYLYNKFIKKKEIRILSKNEVKEILSFGGMDIKEIYNQGTLPTIFKYLFNKRGYFILDTIITKLTFNLFTINRVYVAKKKG